MSNPGRMVSILVTQSWRRRPCDGGVFCPTGAGERKRVGEAGGRRRRGVSVTSLEQHAPALGFRARHRAQHGADCLIKNSLEALLGEGGAL